MGNRGVLCFDDYRIISHLMTGSSGGYPGAKGYTMAGKAQVKPGTAERLIEAAVRRFANKWYGTVSVAEICRAAGLSNGVFYRYFPDKETLFKHILGQVLELVREAVEGVEGEGPEARLRNLAATILAFPGTHRDLVSVFREGQYRFFDFERRLMGIYLRALGSALGREAGRAEYLFALGGLRFCANRKAFNDTPIDYGTLCAILDRGIFRGLSVDAAKVFGGSASLPAVPLAEGARERLLRSGRRLFGAKGYFETNIHEITDSAQLSVGAFYTYFETKDAFYREIIVQVGQDARQFTAGNLNAPGAGPLNLLEFELRRLWLWLVYLSYDKGCYSILREAEFILPDAVRAYYDSIAAGYLGRAPESRLTCGAPDLDEGTVIEFVMGLAHYFGMEAAFDDTLVNIRGLVEALGGHLARGFSAIPPNPT